MAAFDWFAHKGSWIDFKKKFLARIENEVFESEFPPEIITKQCLSNQSDQN